ncbi:MAG: hypothetical protein K9H49_12430 [Bacteroidales bacterium]|nr:hypothetical protein [Bacteroidales bacterium]MCF8390603.1 hypothetical protein [Bacteroidales bacterium]
MRKIILLALAVMAIASCGNNSNTLKKNEQAKLDSLEIVKAKRDSISRIILLEKEKDEYHKTFMLRKKYIGFIYKYPQSIDFIAEFGSPETLSGTNNDKWIVYFPKGNFTVVQNKKTNKFENICAGKYPNLKNDVTAELSKIIGKRMKYSEYIEEVNSIKYGVSEKLGMTNCVNKDCVEYYSKGNFTTVAFLEFNDNRDFVTLKKIAIGKVPRLNEY